MPFVCGVVLLGTRVRAGASSSWRVAAEAAADLLPRNPGSQDRALWWTQWARARSDSGVATEPSPAGRRIPTRCEGPLSRLLVKVANKERWARGSRVGGLPSVEIPAADTTELPDAALPLSMTGRSCSSSGGAVVGISPGGVDRARTTNYKPSAVPAYLRGGRDENSSRCSPGRAGRRCRERRRVGGRHPVHYLAGDARARGGSRRVGRGGDHDRLQGLRDDLSRA